MITREPTFEGILANLTLTFVANNTFPNLRPKILPAHENRDGRMCWVYYIQHRLNEDFSCDLIEFIYHRDNGSCKVAPVLWTRRITGKHSSHFGTADALYNAYKRVDYLLTCVNLHIPKFEGMEEEKLEEIKV